MFSKVIFCILILYLKEGLANYPFNYDNFYDYGLHNFQYGLYDNPFRHFGSSYAENYDQTSEFPYYMSPYGPSIGSSFQPNYRSSKTSNKKKTRRYGKLKPCDHLENLSQYKTQDNYLPLASYRTDQLITDSYSKSYSPILPEQQIDQILPLIALLAKRLLQSQPVIQNFVNPVLGKSNQLYHELPQSVDHKVGEVVVRRKPQNKKSKFQVGKVILEDMIMDKNPKS